jgi:hypothetical protein
MTVSTVLLGMEPKVERRARAHLRAHLGRACFPGQVYYLKGVPGGDYETRRVFVIVADFYIRHFVLMCSVARSSSSLYRSLE